MRRVSALTASILLVALMYLRMIYKETAFKSRDDKNSDVKDYDAHRINSKSELAWEYGGTDELNFNFGAKH